MSIFRGFLSRDLQLFTSGNYVSRSISKHIVCVEVIHQPIYTDSGPRTAPDSCVSLRAASGRTTKAVRISFATIYNRLL